MRTKYRWTVRNVEPGNLRLLEEIKGTTGRCYGDLINEAIEYWYESLPEDEQEATWPADERMAV